MPGVLLGVICGLVFGAIDVAIAEFSRQEGVA
jgi:hypothetical protein